MEKEKSKREIVLSKEKWGRWLVLGQDEDKSQYIVCKCECGNMKSIRVDSLYNGESTSCGCYAREVLSKRTKGKINPDAVYRDPLYSVYKGMFNRCCCKSNKDYKWYGGKGVKVCARWTSPRRDTIGFINFREDMKGTYKKGLEIERLDVEGDYSPENCKWVSRQSQLHNTTRNRRVSGWGVELSVTEWGYLLKFNGKMLDDRINKLNWKGNLEEILEVAFSCRQHKLLYKGEICSANDIWYSGGFTEGQRNARLTKHGDSITALKAEGFNIEVVEPREKEYLTFKEGLALLKRKERDDFEDHLLYKIETQLGDK